MRVSRCKVVVTSLAAPMLLAAGCASPIHRSYAAHDAAPVQPVSAERLAEVRQQEAVRGLAVVDDTWD